MPPRPRRLPASLLLAACLGCGSQVAQQQATTPPAASGATLAANNLTGAITPVRDPSILRQGATYYLFSTDISSAAAQGGSLPIRCSPDKIAWSTCGYVFATLPAWVSAAVPGAVNLWAPDISYFGGAYHLYYAASTLLSQVSAVGEATNTTLDPSSPQYHWVDHGQVLASTTGDDFNAIDPNIAADSEGHIWLTYGSFWTGIKQREVDPSTGMLAATNPTVYALASRPSVPDHAIEGASLVQHAGYYYLFLSTGHCCEALDTDDDYQQIVGRSRTVHGPFVDKAGMDLEDGGGTVLLTGDATWNAPGGGSAYLDASTGDSLLVFHAAKLSENGATYLWLKQLTWQNDWPVLQ